MEVGMGKSYPICLPNEPHSIKFLYFIIRKQRTLLLDGIIVLLKIIGEIFLTIIKIIIKDPPKDISGEIVLVRSLSALSGHY